MDSEGIPGVLIEIRGGFSHVPQPYHRQPVRPAPGEDGQGCRLALLAWHPRLESPYSELYFCHRHLGRVFLLLPGLRAGGGDSGNQ